MALDRESLDKAISDTERERREESATRRLLTQARNENERLERLVDMLSVIDAVRVDVPEWGEPPKTKRNRRVTANLMLSDLHLDEVVDVGVMAGKNAYDREIAAKRLRRVGDNTIKIARDYIGGVSYDGLYLWVNGDIVSGTIHDEFERTNAGHGIADTIDYWTDPLAGLFDQLADFFGKVHVVCSYGNHGRAYKKPPHKQSVRSSWDWLTIRGIWRGLRSDQRFTWNIPESRDVRQQCYNTRYLMQHGDDFQGGDQIAGAVRPVMMGDYRQLIVEVMDGDPYDVMLVAHFHQYHALPRAIINGSLIGYNEYAKDKKFRPEPPKQAFWLTTPEHGASFHLPILPQDRGKEGW